MSIHEVVDENLEAMAAAPRYNAWLHEVIAPWIGRRVLEAGGGIGNLTRHLLGSERLVTIDYLAAFVDRLRAEFGHHDHVRVERFDLTELDAYDTFASERLDTIVCLNVLEHLEPDVEVLRRFHDLLEPGGHAIILVPQGMWLYGSLDEAQGHFRRYSRAELEGKLREAGFEVAAMTSMNCVAPFGWFVNGRILGKTVVPADQVAVFERLVPLVRLLDKVLPLPGISVIGVGRKPKPVP